MTQYLKRCGYRGSFANPRNGQRSHGESGGSGSGGAYAARAS
jgi:hypothetical protein